MSVLRKILEKGTKDITRSILSSSERYFTTLVASGSMHYTIPSITFTGDFEISFLLTSSTMVDESIISSSDNSSWIRINSLTQMSFRIDNVERGIVLSGLTTTKLHTIRVVKSGTTVTAFVDGNQTGNATGVTETNFTLAQMSKQGTISNNIDGILANVSIIDAGTLARFYKINVNLSNGSTIIDSSGNGQNGTAVNISESDLFTLQSNGDYLGVELWTLPPYVFTGSETNGDLPQSLSVLDSGRIYTSTFSVSGSNPGDTTGFGNRTRALIGNFEIESDGNPSTVTGTGESTSTTARWQVNGTAPFSGTVSIDSVKQLLESA